MSSPSQRFALLNNFRGYGNPKGPLWFVGLEGAAKWDRDYLRDVDKYKKYSLGSFPFELGEIRKDAARFGRHYTKVYDVMSKFAIVASTGLASSLSKWREYQNSKLLLEGDDTFQANLYPLGKPRMNQLPDHYISLFDLDSTKAYYQKVGETRFPMLRAFRNEHQPPVTVCFGWAAANGDFERLFELEGNFEDLDTCRFYESGVVLSPFFNPLYMADDAIVTCALHCAKKYLGPRNWDASRHNRP